jgi:hypothetical protein
VAQEPVAQDPKDHRTQEPGAYRSRTLQGFGALSLEALGPDNVGLARSGALGTRQQQDSN